MLQWCKRPNRALLAFPVLAVVALALEIKRAIRGPLLPERELELNDNVPGPRSAGPVRMIWLGDSTAAGIGATDGTLTMAHQTAQLIEHPTELTVLAVSGARMHDVLKNQLTQLNDYKADVVVISIGANDVTHLTSRSTYSHQLRLLLNSIPRQTKTILVGIPEMSSPTRLQQPLRWLVGRRARSLRGVERRIAEQLGVTYVDVAAHTGQEFRSKPNDYFAEDLYHPNDAGHRLWAEAIAPAVRQIMKSGSTSVMA